jgi:hypothetical protein
MSDEKTGEKEPQLEMFAVWQKMMSGGMENFLRNPLLLATMGKGLEDSAAFKEQIDKSLQAYLQALNLPSTRDVQGVLEGLRTLQGEVEALKAQIDQLLRTPGSRKGSGAARRQTARRRRGDGRAGSN